MGAPERRDLELLREAVATESAGQRRLLAGDADAGQERLRAAAALYRASWEAAPPRSYGRLIGMLKAAVIAGDAHEQAAYARAELTGAGEPAPAQEATSPAAAYALALAALALGDDDGAREHARGMRGASPAFDRTAEALAALADRDEQRYGAALEAIVADFEGRERHLTGIPFADTALALERLAAPRGLERAPSSPLLPG